MVTKVVYIGYQPLTKKVKEDFYFDIILNNGLEVEYWDLSDIYFPNILKGNLFEEYIIKIKTFKHLKKRILSQPNDNCLYVIHITFEYRVIKLFRLLTKYSCKTCFFARGSLPISGNITSTKVKLVKALNVVLLIRFMKNKYAAFLKKIGRIKYYDLVFSAGELGYLTVGCGSDIERSNSKIIDINSTDYDVYLDIMHIKNNKEKKYCLFLDEYLPHHPDFILLGIKSVSPDIYYKSLNDFFKLIEKKFNFEVIVAAHPKAEGYKNQNPFEGREIYFNETAMLTKFCEFTLTHLSTSQSFSVLNDKPIISLTSDCIQEVMPQYDRFITHTSVILGNCLINIDNDLPSDINMMNTDDLKYDDYKYKYLTSKTSELEKSSEVFIKTILKL